MIHEARYAPALCSGWIIAPMLITGIGALVALVLWAVRSNTGLDVLSCPACDSYLTQSWSDLNAIDAFTR